MPKVSFLVPVYNAEQYLEECVDSILAQSYKDIEVLLVDDGSTDSSGAICEQYASKDSRVRFFHQENAGVSAARNLALDNAKGEFVCFVDSDDVLAKEYLKHLLELSDRREMVMCQYTSNKSQLGTSKGEIVYYDAKAFIVGTMMETISHHNIWLMLFKKNIIDNANLRFTVGCVKNEDTEFYVNYLVNVNNVVITNHCDYYYRLNPTSVMRMPLTLKSLTSIEASKRMNKLLYNKGIIEDSSIITSNGVLNYTYSTAKHGNKEMYDYIHIHYSVKEAMKTMLKFPRFVKRIVALSYVLLGRKGFYNLIRMTSIR